MIGVCKQKISNRNETINERIFLRWEQWGVGGCGGILMQTRRGIEVVKTAGSGHTHSFLLLFFLFSNVFLCGFWGEREMGFGIVKKKKEKEEEAAAVEVVGQLTVVENDGKGSPESLEFPQIGLEILV